MPTLKAPNGKRYSTENVPDNYDLIFCNKCQEPICWQDSDFTERPILVCEDCIANMRED